MPNLYLTLAAQRKALVDVLAGVRGIGVVYDYRRVIRTENDIRSMLVPDSSVDGTINSWMVYPSPTNTTVTERGPGHVGIGVKGGGNDFTTFQWQIDGYYGIEDAKESEKTFHDLCFAIVEEFNAQGLISLPGLTHQLPADINEFGFISLAGLTLCHFGKIGIGLTGRTRSM